MTTKKEITNYIENAIKKAQEEKKISIFEIPEILIESSENKEHGDYATNIAFLLGKATGKTPQAIAELLKEYISPEEPIEKIEVISPGFINFWLTKKALIENLKIILKQKNNYARQKQKGTIVIDYSAPNIAKPFGIGHLRSTIIGQAIYNTYKFLGWKCIGDNHLGDWGTQFGKLIVAIKKWSKKEVEKLFIDEFEKLYVKFHKEAEKNPELEEEARKWFQKLEKGDKEAKKIWQACAKTSTEEFERIYKILGISFDNALGESFYENKMESIIKDAQEKGLAQMSQGALVIFVPKVKTPLMLLKSDGATTYETRELAAIKYRMEKWNPDLVIYEVGADQKEHLAKCFTAAEMLGYVKKEQLIHIAHGLIRWPHGKFSTRKGDTIHLKDILKQSIQRAEALIKKSQKDKIISKDEGEKIAQLVGIGAIKYNDLSRHYSKDIVFDWESIFNLEGNSGPYIQYTIARSNSILKKTKQKIKINDNVLLETEEVLLLRFFWKFPEIIQKSSEKFSPNLICNFIFELSQLYNLFYEKHSILGAENEEKKNIRISLTYATKYILEIGLGLLGISASPKM